MFQICVRFSCHKKQSNPLAAPERTAGKIPLLEAKPTAPSCLSAQQQHLTRATGLPKSAYWAPLGAFWAEGGRSLSWDNPRGWFCCVALGGGAIPSPVPCCRDRGAGQGPWGGVAGPCEVWWCRQPAASPSTTPFAGGQEVRSRLQPFEAGRDPEGSSRTGSQRGIHSHGPEQAPVPPGAGCLPAAAAGGLRKPGEPREAAGTLGGGPESRDGGGPVGQSEVRSREEALGSCGSSLQAVLAVPGLQGVAGGL